MPTNEERREVAARLRNWESFRETFRESPICATLDVLNVEGYLDWRGVCELLADLIEPEPERTCKAIDDFVLPGQVQTYPYKICSNCHSDFPRLAWCGEFSVGNYCPNCGAKVVGDE